MNAQGSSTVLWGNNIWGGAGVLSGILDYGYATFMGEVVFKGKVIFEAMVVFAQDVIFDAPVIINSDLTVNGDLNITGAIDFHGDLVVDGTLTVEQDTTLNSDLTVTGNVEALGSTITLNGSQKVLISGDTGDAHGIEMNTPVYVSDNLLVENGTFKVSLNGVDDNILAENESITLAGAAVDVAAATFDVQAPVITMTGVAKVIGSFEVLEPNTPGSQAVFLVGNAIMGMTSRIEAAAQHVLSRVTSSNRYYDTMTTDTETQITVTNPMLEMLARWRMSAPDEETPLIEQHVNNNINGEGLSSRLNPLNWCIFSTYLGVEQVPLLDVRRADPEDPESLDGVEMRRMRVGPPLGPGGPRTRQVSRKSLKTIQRGELIGGGAPFIVEVEGNENHVGDIDIEGDLVLVGPLDVTGAVELTGEVNINGSLDIEGAVVIIGTLDAGDVTCAAVQCGDVAAALIDGTTITCIDLVSTGQITGVNATIGTIEAGAIVAGSITSAGGIGSMFGHWSFANPGIFPAGLKVHGVIELFNSYGAEGKIFMKNHPGETQMDINCSEVHVNADKLKIIGHTGGDGYLETTGDVSCFGNFRGTYYFRHNDNDHIAVGGSEGGATCEVRMKGPTNFTSTTAATFNTVLPTSSLTPTSPDQLVTKTYVDTLPGVNLLASDNTWTGANAFNTSLPTSSLTPTISTQLVTKTYVDNHPGLNLLADNNTWLGTNAFNNYLPTSTSTPTNPDQLVTKTYVDTQNNAQTLQTAYSNGAPAALQTILLNSSKGYVNIQQDAGALLTPILNVADNTGASIVGVVKGYGLDLGSGTFVVNKWQVAGYINHNTDAQPSITANGSSVQVKRAYCFTNNTGTSYRAWGFYVPISNSVYSYFGNSSIGTNTPNCITTWKVGVGMKISTGSDTSDWTEQLRVIGKISATDTVQGVSPTVFGYLVGITSGVQAQLDGKGGLGSPNTWTSTNTFNTLPTSTATPTLGTQLVTKTYADSRLSSNNTWTGTNTFSGATSFTSATATTFNTSLPTSSLTPTLGTELVTKTYVDDHSGANLLTSNNVWTGTNTFNNAVRIGEANASSASYYGGTLTLDVGSNPAPTNTLNIGGSCNGQLTSNLTNTIYIGGAGQLSQINDQSLTVDNTIYIGRNVISSGYLGFPNTSSVTTNNTIIIGGKYEKYNNSDVNSWATSTTVRFEGLNPTDHFKSPETNFGTVVAGVFHIRNSDYTNAFVPLCYSIPDITNITSQANTSGALTTGNRQDTGLSAAGDWGMFDINDKDSYFYVRPGFGLVAYSGANYADTLRINFKNTAQFPVIVRAANTHTVSSVKIYFQNVEQVKPY